MLQARHEDGISSDVADIEDALLLPQLGPILKGSCRPEDYWGPNRYKLIDQIGGVDLEAYELLPIAAHYRLLLPVAAHLPIHAQICLNHRHLSDIELGVRAGEATFLLSQDYDFELRRVGDLPEDQWGIHRLVKEFVPVICLADYMS